MKNKQLKKSIKSKMIPITKRLNTESELYLYNETLIKLYNSKVNLEDKKRILDKLSTFDIKECLTPTFALYEGSTLSGIQMDYLYDYDAIYDILNNGNLDFNTRKMIAFKICQIILEIESKNDSKKTVEKWVKKLGLQIENAYRLSWDDKYRELCQSQKIKQYNIVTFDKEMPVIDEK